jgi:TolA-binding protein
MKKAALFLTLGLLLLSACGAPEPEPAAATTAAATTNTTTTTQIITTTQITTTQTSTTQETTTQTPATTKTALPQTNAQILAQYTEVMNRAKREKIRFTKVQYQDAPKAQREADGAAVKILEPFLGVLFTSEKDARKSPYVGNDPAEFPVVQSEKGCYITDVNIIKSAKAEQLPGGNIRLTIVLKDQQNAQPYWAAHEANGIGGMFDLARKEDFDEALAGMPISDPQYNLTYYDCTAVLEYNPASGLPVNLYQTTYARAEASFAFLGGRNSLRFVVVDKTEIQVTNA